MNKKSAIKIVPLLVSFSVLLATTGCVLYKNPASSVPPPTITKQWQVRYPLHLCVKNPHESDFNCITNGYERKWKLEQAYAEAQRLVKILNQCHLFKDVTLSDAGSISCDLTIEAIPRVFETSEFDWGNNPWIIFYGSIFPLYSENDMGVNFKFLKPTNGDFKFDWTEEYVVGFWALAVDIFGTNWHFSDSSSQYWNRLRSALIQKFDQIRL